MLAEINQPFSIQDCILWIRGKRVMIDADLARIYGTETKRLNEQVRRNFKRFPPDFMFQLTVEEKLEVVAICDHLKNIKYSNRLPYVFSEHGTIMLASVLNTAVAIEASIEVVRAFVYFKETITINRNLKLKIDSLEKKYDHQFKIVFDAIRELMAPPIVKKLPIGFGAKK